MGATPARNYVAELRYVSSRIERLKTLLEENAIDPMDAHWSDVGDISAIGKYIDKAILELQ